MSTRKYLVYLTQKTHPDYLLNYIISNTGLIIYSLVRDTYLIELNPPSVRKSLLKCDYTTVDSYNTNITRKLEKDKLANTEDVTIVMPV